MRYHHEDDRGVHVGQFATTYICDHPVYSKCTLYRIRDIGLAVIQQKYDPDTKATTWGEIDLELIDVIYLHPKFYAFFKSIARPPTGQLYPTVTIRQLMWALRMKPLKREPWETYFDRKGF